MSEYRKIIKSGKVVEVYSYEKAPRIEGRPRAKSKHPVREVPNDGRLPDLARKREDNIKRCRQRFIRLVRANTGRGDTNALITLTYAAIVDIETATRHFNQFTGLLRKTLGTDFRYIGVPEFQERGAVHFHVLYWRFPTELVSDEKPHWKQEEDIGQMDKIERGTRFIQNCWAYGYVDCIPTDNSERLAGYLAKYMSKAMQDERLLRKRAYYYSRNIYRPDSSTFSPLVNYLNMKLEETATLITDRDFETKWLGMANYKRFELEDESLLWPDPEKEL
jgi:hypothetical protein